ncbi:MAG: DUF4142 domain-containing protein [Myxococcales bacterium]
MARTIAASQHPSHRPVRAATTTLSLLTLFGAGCAKNTPQHQQPITENLAPAVASPATEAISMPDRDSTGYYSNVADAKEMGVTAPMEEPGTPEYDENEAAQPKPRVIVHEFVPKVTRVMVPTITTMPATVTETPVAATGLTDGQIVRVAQTMQDAELAQASIVAERAQSDRVKKFAAQLQSENKNLKDRTQALAKSDKLTPVESTLSADMRVKASQELTSVELAKPEEFDRAFIDAQVEQNQQLLELLDNRLIPDASEPKLKATLSKSRSVLERQGEEAKEIQRVMQNAPESTP